MKKHLTKRLLSLVVVLALCLGMMAVPGFAAEPNGLIVEKADNSAVSAIFNNLKKYEETAQETVKYGEHDNVRVSIVLGGKSTLELSNEKGISLQDYLGSKTLTSHRANLLKDQQALAARISEEVLNGAELDVVWNLTLAANIISANVEYGQIEAIKAVKGVKDVVLECQYEPAVAEKGGEDPNMATSPVQTGSSIAHLAGYTGAGSRIAIIDTGTDLYHQSFNNDAFLYALAENAEKAGMEYDEYIASLDLLDAAEIEAAFGELNISDFLGNTDGVYINEKHAFTVSYIDYDLDVSHYNSEHGSHVAGIATANRYISDGNGGFVTALESVKTQGVAPDAQLLTMQVFGNGGGAYDSDYMAAIEDAIVLKADAVNLSLGSGSPGMTTSDTYENIMNSLVESGMVSVMSAGNSGMWADSSTNGLPYLFAGDVGFHTGGSPGTFTNSLGVASVDNAGFTALCVKVDGTIVTYAESAEYGNAPIVTIGGEKEYVFLNGIGTAEQFEAIKDAVAGKVALCYRGETSFFEKANAAVAAGAIGVIIVNNQPGVIGLNLTGYEYSAPVVSITQADGEYFKLGDPVTEGDIQYWTGTMEVGTAPEVGLYGDEYYTMSSFSSWGVPGDLSMKPEITAPGGSIYSVYGTIPGTSYGGVDQYVQMSGTSMAAPQVTGMVALVMQYIRENGLSVDGLTDRALAMSLLMSTAVPMRDGNSGGNYYPVLQQGSGLANVGAAVLSNSYILMGEDATDSWADGKVKVELGDDPAKTGYYEFNFSINNLTDNVQYYTLSAEFFTQDMFSYAGIALLDTWTTPVASNVTWLAEGKTNVLDPNLDFDGNGLVNDDDGQALLDYATGARSDLYNIDYADIDGDHAIDSHDAYAFLAGIYSNAVAVPANGSVEVTVQVQLDTAMLDQYPNGAYVEGYVYADCLSTEEGVAGESHSIPVLGYYGNWTDPSMFEVGSFMEYYYGLETRPGYLYGLHRGQTNMLLAQYNGLSGDYIFGGNPMVADPEYYPERNAISTANGDTLSKLAFTSIRNAGNSLLLVTNAETGEVYTAQELGELGGAYYHVNQGAWKNVQWTLNIGGLWRSLDLPNDTVVSFSMVLAPEYYAETDGSYDWNSILAELGDGAIQTHTLTVDNTAPVINEESVTIDEENGLLTLLASDNQYVSFVALYDEYGQYLYTFTGSYADANPGDELEYALDLTEVGGTSFLLQVYDYAGNASTYKITQQIGEVTEEITEVVISETSLVMSKGDTATLTAIVYPANAISRDVVWTSSNESVATVDENGVITGLSMGETLITATAAADETKSASCAVTVIDIDVDMNAIVWDEEGSIWFSEFNTTELPDYTKLSGDMLETDYFVAAAVGADGTLYASTLNTSNGTGALYTIDPTTYEATKLSDCMVQGLHIFYSDLTYVPAMFGTGVLLGSYGPFVIAIDPTTGTAIDIIDQYDSDIVGITTCYGMYDPDSGVYQDVVYVIEGNGTVTQEIYYGYDGAVVPYMYYFYGERASFDCGVDVGDAWYFNSAYYNGEYLFWSAFDQDTEDSVTLYAIDADYSGNVYTLGQFAESVWPVGGLHQLPASSASVDSALLAEVRANMAGKDLSDAAQYTLSPIEWVVDEQPAEGGLNAVTATVVNGIADIRPMSETEIDVDSDTLVLNVTAKDTEGRDYATTNGVFTVTYDPASMVLDSISVNGDYESLVIDETAGVITIGYVNLDGIPAGETVATLTFTVIGEEIHPEIEYLQANNFYINYTEVAHDFGEWYTVHPARVNVDGLDRRDCKYCDHYETRVTYYYGEPSDPMPGTPAPEQPGTPGTPGGGSAAPSVPGSSTMVPGPGHSCSVIGFSDLSSTAWYHNAVDYVVANGIMNGTGDGSTFSPYLNMTRAMMMTILARMSGVDTSTGSTWYEVGMKWAVENGISDGTNPNADISREQLITMLYRYAGSPAVSSNNYLSVYSDGSSVSEWAKDAMNWAVSNGILQGKGNGTLDPQGLATRVEVAQILMNYGNK